MLEDAFALHAKGKFTEAERAYNEVLRRQPGNFRALHLLGLLALQRGQVERGIELLGKSLQLESRQPLAHRDLGNAFQQSERYEEALACYDKALALKPDLADAHNNRGIALAQLRRLDEAVASYGQAIALKPDYAQAYNNRGTILSGLKRTDEALADFSKAIALVPGYAKAFSQSRRPAGRTGQARRSPQGHRSRHRLSTGRRGFPRQARHHADWSSARPGRTGKL